jgi:hypothetical protein
MQDGKEPAAARVRAAECAIRHYQAGDFRNAVLDAITAVFDKIRERTKMDLDGDRLINQTMSPHAAVLILSELGTDSGRYVFTNEVPIIDIYRVLSWCNPELIRWFAALMPLWPASISCSQAS